MPQTVVTLISELQPDLATAACRLIEMLKAALVDGKTAGDPTAPIISAVPGLHFASMMVFEDERFDPVLTLELNFDGPVGAFLPRLETPVLSPHLRAILRCCKPPEDRRLPMYQAVTAADARLPVAPYLETLIVKPAVFHQGNRGLERTRILREAKLFGDVQLALDAPDCREAGDAPSLHTALRGRVVARNPWLDEFGSERVPMAEHVLDLAKLVGLVVLVVAVLLAPGLIVWLASPGLGELLPWIALAALLALAVAVARTRKPATQPTPRRAPQLPPATISRDDMLLYRVGGGALLFIVVCLFTPWSRAAEAGLILIVIGIVLWLHKLETTDKVHTKPQIDPDKIREIMKLEDRIFQNHMGSIVHVKPGVLRAILIRLGLTGLGLPPEMHGDGRLFEVHAHDPFRALGARRQRLAPDLLLELRFELGELSRRFHREGARGPDAGVEQRPRLPTHAPARGGRRDERAPVQDLGAALDGAQPVLGQRLSRSLGQPDRAQLRHRRRPSGPRADGRGRAHLGSAAVTGAPILVGASSWKLAAAIAPDVQGLVVSGFGDQPAACALLLSAQSQGGAWIAALQKVAPVTAAAVRQMPSVALAFTSLGLDQLGLDTLHADFAQPFVEGMMQEDRRRRLGDVDTDGKVLPTIEWGLRGAKDAPATSPPVHALLLVYDSSHDALAAHEAVIGPALEAAGVQVVRRIALDLLINGDPREHFGFVDGISQPIPYGAGTSDGAEKPFPRDPLHGVPLGEILLGHPDAHAHATQGPFMVGTLGPDGAFAPSRDPPRRCGGERHARSCRGDASRSRAQRLVPRGARVAAGRRGISHLARRGGEDAQREQPHQAAGRRRLAGRARVGPHPRWPCAASRQAAAARAGRTAR